MSRQRRTQLCVIFIAAWATPVIVHYGGQLLAWLYAGVVTS